MKKIILSIAVSVIALSCNKKQSNLSGSNQEPVANKTEAPNPVKNTSSRTKPKYMLFFKSPKYFVCFAQGGNCLPMIVVKPHSAALVGNLIAVVEDKSQTTIREYFVTNNVALQEYMESIDIDGVINGDLLATTETNPELRIKFLVLKNASNNEIEIVYQFPY